jgi:hypothetical protein
MGYIRRAKFLEKGAENARDRVDAVIRREMEL